jgi:hypothetical protein
MMNLNLGDEVSCNVHNLPTADYGLVIGESPHSRDGDIVVIANEKAIGMPVNVCHLKLTGKSDVNAAEAYRARYLNLYPTAMKEGKS